MSDKDRPDRRKARRLRHEVEAERKETRDRVEKELDQIVQEAHAQLPREQAQQIGALYARYSTKHQDSILDQIRSLLEAAVRQHIFVPREYIFFDMAISGCRERRPGLDGLRAILAKHAVQILLVFATNRLYRKTYRSLQFVEEEVVERGIRCQFVKSGIDTADEQRWRMMLQFHAMMDEAGLGMYSDNIRAAHEGLFDHGQVCGTITFGYGGEPIPGMLTKDGEPARRYVIDEEEARWVRLIFCWYVIDLVPLAEIIRRLNAEPTAPLGPRNTTGRWTRVSVRGVLTNARYRGYWEYGATRRVFQSKKDYFRQIPRLKPLRSEQIEERRIVDDEIWYKAQKRLAERDRCQVGRKPKDGDRKRRPRLAHGLFFCPVHDRFLYVGGPYGTYLKCKSCEYESADRRTLFTQLSRELAVRLTCERLAELVCGDQALIAFTVEAFRCHNRQMRQPDPTQLETMRKTEAHLSAQIQFLLNDAGATEQDRKEAVATLQRLRQQRAEVGARLKQLEGGKQQILVPTEDVIARKLNELGDLLTQAASSEDEAEIAQAREAIRSLTGGRIDLYQQGERRSHGGWLQGRFRVRILPYLFEKLNGTQPNATADTGVEVVIDYRDDHFKCQCDRAKALYDQGMRNCEIATALGTSRSRVTLLVGHWFQSRGLPVPDGRKHPRK